MVITGFYIDLGAEGATVRILKEAKKGYGGLRLSGVAARRDIATFWGFVLVTTADQVLIW